MKTTKKMALFQLGVMLAPVGIGLMNSPIVDAADTTVGKPTAGGSGPNLSNNSDFVWSRRANDKTAGVWLLPMKGNTYQYCLDAGIDPSIKSVEYEKVMKNGYLLDKVSNIIACGMNTVGKEPIYPDIQSKKIDASQARLITQLAVWKALGQGNRKHFNAAATARVNTTDQIITATKYKKEIDGLIKFASEHQANDQVIKVNKSMSASEVKKQEDALKKEAEAEAKKKAGEYKAPADVQKKAKDLVTFTEQGKHTDDKSAKMHVFKYKLEKKDPAKVLGKDFANVKISSAKLTIATPLPKGTQILVDGKEVIKDASSEKTFDIPFGNVEIKVPFTNQEGSSDLDIKTDVSANLPGKEQSVTKTKKLKGYDGEVSIFYKAVPDDKTQAMGIVIKEKVKIKDKEISATGKATPSMKVTDDDKAKLNWEAVVDAGIGGGIEDTKPGIPPKKPTPGIGGGLEDTKPAKKPIIHTLAIGKDGTDYVFANNSDKETIEDTIYYEGLEPGKEYHIDGNFKLKESGEDTKLKGGLDFKADEDGKGEVKVLFKGDVKDLAGKDIVAFETLKDKDGKVVATHADLNDENQTLHIPKLKTLATVDGEKTFNADGTITVTDKIEYSGFKPNEEVTLKGQMMDHDSKEAISKLENVKFKTNEKGSGVAEVKMTVDAKDVGPNGMVAFEKAYVNNGKGKPVLVASHEDIDDKGQTVTPKPVEKAFGQPAKKEIVEKQVPVKQVETKLIQTAEKIKNNPTQAILIAGITLAVIGGSAYLVKKRHQ